MSFTIFFDLYISLTFGNNFLLQKQINIQIKFIDNLTKVTLFIFLKHNFIKLSLTYLKVINI